jgi:hypothetical protein
MQCMLDGVPGGGEVVELAVRREDDDADAGVAEDGELPGLLEQPRAALAECHLPVHRVLDAPKLHLAPRHGRSVSDWLVTRGELELAAAAAEEEACLVFLDRSLHSTSH